MRWPRLGIYKAPDGSWFVPSRKVAPGAYWRVERHGQELSCGCPAGMDESRREPCWHVVAVLEVDTANDRPQAPPAPASWFVD